MRWDPKSPPVRVARGVSLAATVVAGLTAGSSAAAASPSPYTLFEAGQVRPLALSPDGRLLFAVNTPAGRLEVFRVDGGGLHHRTSVPVGLEPVAVAARSNDEVWVVNHLSDSVSVVHLDHDDDGGGVVRTLLVGDEPRDIVFAGPGRQRAFVTTAHRGQNSPVDPQLATPGVGRADVWVFDAAGAGGPASGAPLTIVNLFTDTPRALAVSPDGQHVYAAGFHSGNRTTTITQSAFTEEEIGLLPGPATNAAGVPAPATGIIVKFDGSHWIDEAGTAWDDKVRLSLPDKDVFVLDAAANPPVPVAGGFYAGVGTVLYNMAVNPVSGRVYVSNTEAHNDESFEGPGLFAGHSVRGHFADNRVTVLGPSGAVTPRGLNTHIHYGSCCAPVPNAESVQSLALPTGMVVSADGKTLYVAALGSSKVGILGTAALEAGTYVTSTADQVLVSGGGPTGLALDEARGRLYVMTRFDDAISIVDTRHRTEIGHVTMTSPEPPSVTSGRRFLYDASFSSSHGDSACATCHVFGDFDSLAWNLGNPDGQTLADPGPFASPLLDPVTGEPVAPVVHPMKGPMTTQSLRGMANHGPMHWRGDRTGGNDAPSAQPDSGAFDEVAAFAKFQAGFTDLLGRSGPIPDADMDAFTDFILQLRYPPNPIRNLDSSLTPDQQAGRDIFTGPQKIDGGVFTCTQCHTLDPHGNAALGVDAPGFFGTSGLSVPDPEPLHLFKVPHLRNMYQKVGMFGMPPNTLFPFDSFAFTGDQVRGFGFFHDGSADTMFRFHGIAGFTTAASPEGFPLDAQGTQMRRQVEDFLLAFDSNLAPVVGQQVTLTVGNVAVAAPRIALLESRADVGECALVAKSWLGAAELGFLYVGGGEYRTSLPGAPPVDEAWLRAIGTLGGRALTFTCVPPDEGWRVAFDP
jgi:DNA-binding beta-propeller fold protein YncE